MLHRKELICSKSNLAGEKPICDKNNYVSFFICEPNVYEFREIQDFRGSYAMFANYHFSGMIHLKDDRNNYPILSQQHIHYPFYYPIFLTINN